MAHTTLYLERTIDSSHVIPDHPGKCGRLHGHTYRFEVWVSGPVGDDGMVLDFYEIKRLIDAWDHQHLNDIVEFVPTAELLADNMQQSILALARARGAGPSAYGCIVKLWETPSSWAQVGALTDVG